MRDTQAAPRPAADFPVVGIGASAGGITALQTLFRAIPAQPGIAFIVVQHMQPDQPSQLASLLAKWSAHPVREIVEGVGLEPGWIFVAPPGKAVGLRDGTFETEPVAAAGARGIDTVDRLFESLSLGCGARAIAVVLSGTGTDGAAGALCVRQAGGMVLVQEPATAMHDGMPRATIASGAADHVLPLKGLAEELSACAAPDYVRSASAAAWVDHVGSAVDAIVELIRTRASFDFRGYKRAPLLWRIQHRMEVRRVPLFHDYEALLHDDPAELELLVRGIPIHVTEFFRDPAAWATLERDVVPQLFEQARGGAIRAWTPACASGEEAYSLAMLLAERAASVERSPAFQIFATDSAPEIVARASRGVFDSAALSELSPERRQRFFYAADGAFRVKRALREKLVFAPQDLLADPPFSDLDLVTCRNLFIYLDRDAIDRAVYLLHTSLRQGGYLLLGKTESLPRQQRGFEELAPGARIFKKTGRIAEVPCPIPTQPVHRASSRPSRSATAAHAPESAADGAPRSGPADGAGSDAAFDWSEALRFSHEELEASREELQALNEELRASNDLLNLTNDDLAAANAELKLKIGELETQSDILSSGAVMTLFLDPELCVRWFTPAMTELFPLLPGDIGRSITHLAQRFQDTRFVDDVRAVMHENERRETVVRGREGKWFLRSIRPHLNRAKTPAGVAVTFTDISERKRVEEALQLRNLLEMRSLGVVFFDLAGGITGANDAFLDIVGYTREDLEAGTLRYENLLPTEACWRDEQALAELRAHGEGEAGEKEFSKKDGSRVWLYCSSKMLPDGKAVEFVLDITARKQSEAALKLSEERLTQLLDIDTIAVLFLGRDGTLRDANRVFSKLTGWTRQDIESGTLNWRRLTPPEWTAVSEEQFHRLAETGCSGPYEKEYFRKDGTRARLLFTGRELGDGTVVEIAVDVGHRGAHPATRKARRLAPRRRRRGRPRTR